MAIVLMTVFVFGCSSDLVLSLLGIETGVDEQEFREATCKTSKYPFLKKLDQDYLCPIFIRDYKKTDGDASFVKGDYQLEEGGTSSKGMIAPEEKEKLLQEVLHTALRKVYSEIECVKIIEDLASNPHYPLRPRAAVRADSMDELYNVGRTRFSGHDGCIECGINGDGRGHSHATAGSNGGADEIATRCSFVVT